MSARSDSTPKPLVLVGDDDPAHCERVQEVLEQAGFRVLTAPNGNAALELYAQAQPDVVLLDANMPQLDGFEVCEKIRAREAGRETPIFIASALEDSNSVERAYKLGATDFISKPIAWPALPHRIHYVLRVSTSLNDLKGLIRSVPDLIFIVNEDGEVKDALSGPDANHTQQIRALTTAAQINFYPCENDDRARACITRAIETGKPQVYEHYLDGFDVNLETRFIARDNKSVLAIIRDITERKKSEAKIHNLAYYDKLTALPNRQLFDQNLKLAIEKAERDGEKFVVLFIDLDRFKRINDTLGHSIGDELLKSVARRLDDCTRSTDRNFEEDRNTDDIKLARFGGDEFVMRLHGVESEAVAGSIAERILSVLIPPFSCEGHQFVVTPSIGIAMYPNDGATSDELLMNADSAMYRAKFAGRNNFKFYSETMRTKSLHRLDLENEIRGAIENQQFELYYQPKVDINSWSVVGVEALLRWNHPERGNITPDEFIPVAEETGLIMTIDQWVLREACKQVKAWSTLPSGTLPVAVNISGHHFHGDSLVDDTLGALADAGIDACNLELEITESVLLQNVDSTTVALRKLKETGIRLSVDDFGTGYSSLSYLKRFPIDTLKIDRSFVENLHVEKDDAAICAAILAMSRQLGLKVVAEGVELLEQLEFLKSHGCDQMQGFLYSPAVPAAKFESMLAGSPKLVSGSR